MAALPRCFLSCSFQPADKGVLTFFKNLLKETFEVLTAESEDETDVRGKIFPKIRPSRAVFVIFSRRDKIASSKKWTAPPDVLIEAGFALALQHEVFGFLEEGIDERQQGLLRLCTTNYPRYDKNDLENKRDQYKLYIQRAAEKLGDQSPYPYDYTHLMKEVTVYRDGYGVVRNQFTLKFYTDTKTIVSEHMLSGGKSATKGYSLPHLNEMLSNGPQVRKDLGYFFATSIIDGAADTITSNEIGHSPETIEFTTTIDGTFTRSSPLLLYEWSWGAPGLFPASAEDLSTGKRVQDLEDVHSVFRLPPSLGAGVTFVLRFEKPISFTKDPVFRVFGQGDLMVAEKTGEVLLVQRSSLYIVYVCRFASIPYGQVTAQWRPR